MPRPPEIDEYFPLAVCAITWFDPHAKSYTMAAGTFVMAPWVLEGLTPPDIVNLMSVLAAKVPPVKTTVRTLAKIVAGLADAPVAGETKETVQPVQEGPPDSVMTILEVEGIA